MSEWAYVALAFTVVWASLAMYGALLARRVVQAREVAERLQGALTGDEVVQQQDSTVCDAPHAQ